MSQYIQFDSIDDDSIVLLEVEESEIDPELSGSVKIGLRDSLGSSVAIAQRAFSSAMENAIKNSVEPMLSGIRSLSDSPSEAEITFGLKATGEVGNIAVGKLGAETNYTVKLIWKNTQNGTQ